MHRLPCWCLLEQLRLLLSNQVDVGLKFHTNHFVVSNQFALSAVLACGDCQNPGVKDWHAEHRITLLLLPIEIYLGEPVRHSYGQNDSYNFPFGLLSTSLLGFTFVECLSELPIAIGYDRFLTISCALIMKEYQESIDIVCDTTNSRRFHCQSYQHYKGHIYIV
jgi:hypothetical protein